MLGKVWKVLLAGVVFLSKIRHVQVSCFCQVADYKKGKRKYHNQWRIQDLLDEAEPSRVSPDLFSDNFSNKTHDKDDWVGVSHVNLYRPRQIYT